MVKSAFPKANIWKAVWKLFYWNWCGNWGVCEGRCVLLFPQWNSPGWQKVPPESALCVFTYRCSSLQVTYLGKVSTTGMQFLSGCTEKPVIELWKKHTLTREDVYPANALLEIRPFQVWLHHLDLKGEATVHMDTFQVARIAYCTADHNVSPNIFAWVYREINDDLSYQMDCHAVECESKLEAKKLAHAMMEAFKKTFHSMKSDGRIHRNSSSEEVSHEFESDDGWLKSFTVQQRQKWLREWELIDE